MIETIEQLIVMYAPTVLMVISTVLNYVKVLKGLKQDDLKAELNITKAELNKTKAMLKAQRHQNEEIIRTQKELINEVSKVVKYEDVGKN